MVQVGGGLITCIASGRGVVRSVKSGSVEIVDGRVGPAKGSGPGSKGGLGGRALLGPGEVEVAHQDMGPLLVKDISLCSSDEVL